MKNIIKKLGIVAIIVGILSPFISLPSVSAATGDCDYYLNQYFFLDETGGGFWDQYKNGGYTTATMFPYTFASLAEGQTMTIENVDTFDIDKNTDIVDLQNKFEAVLAADYTTIEKAEKYGTVDNSKASSYKQVTHVLHGYWSRTEGNDIYLTEAGHLSDKNLLNENDNLFKDFSIQSVLINNDIEFSDINTTFAEGILDNNTIKTYGNYENNMKDYFQLLVDGVNNNDNSIVEDGYINNYYTLDGIDKNEKYFNISITRSLDADSVLNGKGIVFGQLNNDPNNDGNEDDAGYFAYTKGTGEITINNVDNSYEAWQAWNASQNKSNWYKTYSFVPATATDVDFDLEQTYYWPTILNVEYKVCNTSSTTGKWTLTYDDNVDDTSVTNMPNPISEEVNVGTSIKVSSTTPKRTDYAFNGWCTESNGSGDCYKAGDEVKNSTATKLTLFAQWAKEGTENNNKMGVISYVIGFAAVGVIAGGIYLISKKKNLFKQI